MNPGETILGFDFGNHLWMVLSTPTADGQIALANLTTHGRLSTCGDSCVVVKPGEHPYVVRASCIYYRGALLNPVAPLDGAKARGVLQQHEPCTPELLRRIQDGALASRFVAGAVKAAIRAGLEGS